jgi:nucleoside-diphosphate-sugar epimerase
VSTPDHLQPGRLALVTGATGFIASHLVPTLVGGGWAVRATGRRPRPDDMPADVDYLPVDLAGGDDPAVDHATALAALLDGVTHVFHLAGASSSFADQAEMHRSNVVATERLLEAVPAGRLERFLYMSSTSVYGEEVQLPSPVPEDVERHPSRGYGKAKEETERVVEAHGRKGLPVVTVRPVTVYGPGNIKLLASAILDVAVDARAGCDTVTVASTPVEQRLVHVDDLVAACIHLATHDDAPGRAFNVVLPTYPTSHQVATMVADQFDLPVELSDDPDAGRSYERRSAAHAGMVADGMEARIALTPERFRFLRKANRNNRLSIDALLGTGFTFGHPDLAAGVASTVGWYRANRWIV